MDNENIIWHLLTDLKTEHQELREQIKEIQTTLTTITTIDKKWI